MALEADTHTHTHTHTHIATVQLDLNFALYAALHEPKNIRCVSASAREGDDVSTTRGE